VSGRAKPGPVTADEVRQHFAWRLGPFDGLSRWDLWPVSMLDLAPDDADRLFLGGIYTAGRLWDALRKKRRPAVLRDAALRGRATAAIDAVVAAHEPQREAVRADWAGAIAYRGVASAADLGEIEKFLGATLGVVVPTAKGA
jgi:hypothetical protein